MSTTLPATIVAQLNASQEFKELKKIGVEVGKFREHLASVDEKIRALESSLLIGRQF